MQHYSGCFNEKYDFEDYYNKSSISQNALKKLETNDILILPVRYEKNSSSEDSCSEYLFTQESIDFIKFCRSEKPNINIDVLADIGNIPTRDLHSFDIFLPIFYVLGQIALGVCIDLISEYIKERMRGREHEKAEVEFKIIVNRDGENKELYYKGEANAFRDKFNKIDINDL